jgi:hypothetical protein
MSAFGTNPKQNGCQAKRNVISVRRKKKVGRSRGVWRRTRAGFDEDWVVTYNRVLLTCSP